MVVGWSDCKLPVREKTSAPHEEVNTGSQPIFA